MEKGNKLMLSLRKSRGLLIIIIAALLLELVSATQYYYTHRMTEEVLEKRAEGELTLKAILIKGMLNRQEDVLRNHVWDIARNASNADSVRQAVTRMVLFNPNVKGGGMCFVPNYFSSKDRLYELYSTWYDEEERKVITQQIASERHDYTQSSFWKEAMAVDDYVWVDPYIDNEGAGGLITSYAKAIPNNSEPIGVAAIDVSLEWLRDTIDNRHLYPSSFVLLLTEDGQPIVKPEESRVSNETSEYIIGLINDSTVARQKSRSGRSTIIHFDTDKRDGTVHYANMRGKPHWQLAVVCYDDEVYASLSKLRLRMLLFSLLAFGILLYIISRFARDERNLQRKTMEQERISGELRIASGIQQELLPDSDPSLAGIDDVSVEGRLIPAKDVGGDLYNAFVRDEKLFFCIGDVSGKGVPSALIMAIMQALFRNIASRENNPAHIMTQLNEMACRNNKSNIFVTMFIGVLDLPTGHLRYCNGGHEVPILIEDREERRVERGESAQLAVSLLDAKANLPVGLFDDFSYEMQEMTMQKGSTLFLYTDGLTEARNAQNKQYGVQRVLEMMAAASTTDPKQMVETAIEQLMQFSEGTEQRDDLTMLAINYTPKEEQYLLDEELTLLNNVKEVGTLSTFVKDVMERLNIGKKLAYQLRLALEEAVVNVMEYAYPAGTTGDVHIRVTSNGHRLNFIITDSGIAFNPTEASQADTTLSVEDRPVGGLGILLVRELMDSINYERTDGKNVLTLRKDYEEMKE